MRGVGASLGNQAAALCEMNEVQKAMTLLVEVERICRQYEEWEGLGNAIRNQAVLACRAGDNQTAASRMKAAISAFERARDKQAISDSKDMLKEIQRYL
jgi:hypothetical protein